MMSGEKKKSIIFKLIFDSLCSGKSELESCIFVCLCVYFGFVCLFVF